MITQVFSIFDVKAKSFGVPFYATNKELAMRNVAAVVNDGSEQSGMLSKFPEDFVLYHVASFDDEQGVFEPKGKAEQVCMLVALRR